MSKTNNTDPNPNDPKQVVPAAMAEMLEALGARKGFWYAQLVGACISFNNLVVILMMLQSEEPDNTVVEASSEIVSNLINLATSYVCLMTINGYKDMSIEESRVYYNTVYDDLVADITHVMKRQAGTNIMVM